MKFISLFLITYLSLISFILTEEYKSGLRREDFQKEIDGKKTDLYTLINKNGYEVSITNYGGSIAAIMAPDKDNKFMNIVQGHDSLDHIIECPNQFLSTLIGRYGNRISNGVFYLDGKKYVLNLNDGKNSLHGGNTGFHSRVWDVVESTKNILKLKYISEDGEEGFPGKLTVEVTFSLNDENEFGISYRAKSDKKTIINLTHHMFINLHGLIDPCPTIEDHYLSLNAIWYLPTDENLIPTGEIKSVINTPFDFVSKPKTIKEALICDQDRDIKIGQGIDHNFVLNRKTENNMIFAGKIWEPLSKRKMEIYTTEPGMQIYSGNYHDGFRGYHGVRMGKYSGIAFETQHFPDSPNIAHFPSVVLDEGEEYKSDTIYKFGIEK
jgi:aldose 1-epimerase